MLRILGSTRFLPEVADENSKCIQHDFPRLCREKATGQRNMSATAEFMPLPLIQDEQVMCDRPDTTLAVYRGRQAIKNQTKKISIISVCMCAHVRTCVPPIL